MNIQHLKMLKILDRCQSISKAATCLYLSQSALTRQLLMIEKELGFSLFYRLHDGVKATPSGRYFIDQLEDVLDRYDRAVAGARQRSVTLPAQLRIGIYSYLIHVEMCIRDRNIEGTKAYSAFEIFWRTSSGSIRESQRIQ